MTTAKAALTMNMSATRSATSIIPRWKELKKPMTPTGFESVR